MTRRHKESRPQKCTKRSKIKCSRLCYALFAHFCGQRVPFSSEVFIQGGGPGNIGAHGALLQNLLSLSAERELFRTRASDTCLQKMQPVAWGSPIPHRGAR